MRSSLIFIFKTCNISKISCESYKTGTQAVFSNSLSKSQAIIRILLVVVLGFVVQELFFCYFDSSLKLAINAISIVLPDYVYFETSSTTPYQIRRIEELNKVREQSAGLLIFLCIWFKSQYFHFSYQFFAVFFRSICLSLLLISVEGVADTVC